MEEEYTPYFRLTSTAPSTQPTQKGVYSTDEEQPFYKLEITDVELGAGTVIQNKLENPSMTQSYDGLPIGFKLFTSQIAPLKELTIFDDYSYLDIANADVYEHTDENGVTYTDSIQAAVNAVSPPAKYHLRQLHN